MQSLRVGESKHAEPITFGQPAMGPWAGWSKKRQGQDE